jgi:hypothetical protein
MIRITGERLNVALSLRVPKVMEVVSYKLYSVGISTKRRVAGDAQD